jgi:monoamine oxidase
METFGSASGLYDQAFTESVIDSLDFDYPTGEENPVKWYCIEGGTSLLTDSMVNMIKQKPQLHKKVTSIALDRKVPGDSNMVVEVAGEKAPRHYATVFNTASLACTQRMDLTKAELHPSQKDAIRCLHYDASTKVAIKFNNPWWITQCKITQGGTSSCDLPLRVCVYPSYNLHDGENNSAVLLCSYTWAQDAQRMGSLVNESSPRYESELLDVLFRDLALLHQTQLGYDKTLELIKSSYITHHAFDWYHNPYTSGAFALFGPGQFENYYPWLTRPTANGKLHFVGEASSAHHAWIVGALDSAYRAVLFFLVRYGFGEHIKTLRDHWKEPEELEETTASWQVELGQLKPKWHTQVTLDPESL